MDFVISVAALAVPILTNWIMVKYTHDIVLITAVDICVMYLTDMISQRLRRGHEFRGYYEIDSYNNLERMPVIITLLGFFFYFLGMHSTAGSYRCSGFIFLLPHFYNPLYGLLYLVAVIILVLYFLPKVETVFYQNFFHYNESFLVVIISGILAGAKGIWMVEATYGTCSGNIAWIYGIWILFCVFIQWITKREFIEGLAVRQTGYFSILVGACLIYGHVSFVGHAASEFHPNNVFN